MFLFYKEHARLKPSSIKEISLSHCWPEKIIRNHIKKIHADVVVLNSNLYSYTWVNGTIALDELGSYINASAENGLVYRRDIRVEFPVI